MTEAEVIDVARSGMIVMMKVSAPGLAAGLVAGLIVSIFQTMTSINESTLTFVPKLLAVFITLVLFAPFMLHELSDFTHSILDKMIVGGG